MKKIYTSFLLVSLICFTAIGQSIPNGDFEAWTSGSPDSWNCTNEDLSVLSESNVSEVTSGAANGSSILLESVDMTMFVATGIISNGAYAYAVPYPSPTPEVITGVPFTETPDSLFFHYKSEPGTGDSCVVKLELINSNGKVGEVEWVQTSTVSTWTLAALEIEYANSETPDTLLLVATSSYDRSGTSAVAGSKLYLDNFSFTRPTTPVATDINHSNHLAEISVYPNPFINQVNILSSSSIQSVSLMDISGRCLVDILNNGSNTVQLNLEQLNCGIYIVQVNTENGKILKKIIK